MNMNIGVSANAVENYRRLIQANVSYRDAETAIRTAFAGARRVGKQSGGRQVYEASAPRCHLVYRDAIKPGAIIAVLDAPSLPDEEPDAATVAAIEEANYRWAHGPATDRNTLQLSWAGRVRSEMESKYRRQLEASFAAESAAQGDLATARMLLLRAARHVPPALRDLIYDEVPEEVRREWDDFGDGPEEDL